MANGYDKYGKKVASTPNGKYPGERVNAHRRQFQAVFDLSSADVARNAADTNLVALVPHGHVINHIRVISSVSLATTQLSFGTKTDPVKYGAAKAYGTTADVAVNWFKATAMANEMLTAPEEIIMTIGTAGLPAAGIVIVEVSTSARN